MRHHGHLLDDLKPLEHGETAAYSFIILSKGNYRWRKSDVEAYMVRQRVDRRKVDRRSDNIESPIQHRKADRRSVDRL